MSKSLSRRAVLSGLAAAPSSLVVSADANSRGSIQSIAAELLEHRKTRDELESAAHEIWEATKAALPDASQVLKTGYQDWLHRLPAPRCLNFSLEDLNAVKAAPPSARRDELIAVLGDQERLQNAMLAAKGYEQLSDKAERAGEMEDALHDRLLAMEATSVEEVQAKLAVAGFMHPGDRPLQIDDISNDVMLASAITDLLNLGRRDRKWLTPKLDD